MNPDTSNIEPIRIAPLEPRERSRWEELWTQYQVFYGVVLPPAVTESTWRRLHDGRVHGLGARDAAGRLVGIVHFLYHEDTWSTILTCYLQDLYVDPSFRGSGCGRKLIEAVAAASRRAGANNPYWLTHHTNAVARRLYDRVAENQGFIHYVYSNPAGSAGS
jgi:ribosomal protein S18 acetylase RimI-like enzyme